ncbi:mycothiol synthase [Actinomadura rudentiformis]|uniref:Mycothiol acetyltransferase n=1 Tax=Actinomadura rudentiformis TaxID=359158 RepID=A0A6H9YYI2_9ACTN|nr:mycothiol synthase [Actinomadura rudentiformis]KAB2347797.1 mycothiol synthase [Actinomadura rudentiformis]
MSEVRVRATLSDEEIEKVVRLVVSAAEHDGVGPLSERSLLWLRGGGGGDARGLLRLDDAGGLVGYAHLDLATAEETAAGEFVVDPHSRRRGHGLALLNGMCQEVDGPLRVWAHGDLPAATALAESQGLDRVRALFQMRRSADDPLPEFTVADGVRLRTFEVGQDEEAWLQVNRRAFADHPEQGAWTLDDVRLREREPWFDPEGLFLAESERDGKLLGFHWTKIHPDGLGEVYVVGVDPGAQGLGLGRTLTLKGLHHLRERGVPAILLYVDESNQAAVRLYESLGFTRYAVDVMFQSGC